MSKPVIAAINGPAAGAGLFLALACDLRVMARSAYLKQSNTSYGLSIPAGGSFTLPRLVGMARALEIVLLDESIAASRALEWGLVNTVVADECLDAEVQRLGQRLAQRSHDALGRVKRLFNAAFAHRVSEQLAFERPMVAASANSPEGREGLAAFIEKRQPDFLRIAHKETKWNTFTLLNKFTTFATRKCSERQKNIVEYRRSCRRTLG